MLTTLLCRVMLAVLIILSACAALSAQTPPATLNNSAQRDATRPPAGSATLPTGAQDPAVPPGAVRAALPTLPAAPAVEPKERPEAQPRSRALPPPPASARLGVDASRTLPLTLNEAVRRALENNNDIEVARGDVLLAESQLRAFEGVYEPVLSFTPQFGNSVTPQASTLGGSGQSGTVSQTELQWGYGATKLAPRGGGQYQAFFNNARTSSNSTFNQFSPVYSASLGLTFTQPLLRGRSIDGTRRAIRVQRKRVGQSDADFRRLTVAVISQTQNAYWELVFALRRQQNAMGNLTLTREMARQTEQRIDAGATAPLERAEVQTELANREADLLATTQGVSVAEIYLKRLILPDPSDADWSAQVVPTDAPSIDALPVNLEEALREAAANRPELGRLRLEREINEIDTEFYRDQTRPRIDLHATVAVTGLAGSLAETSASPSGQAAGVRRDLVGGYGRMLRNLVGLDTHSFVVGMTVELPWRNRTAEANLTSASIQQKQLRSLLRSQEQEIEAEVRIAAQSVETARRRIETARAARANAELQLAGEQKLYQVGRSTTFLLFQRENQLVGARTQELRAETDYNQALVSLERATSTTLRANNVVVEAHPGR